MNIHRVCYFNLAIYLGFISEGFNIKILIKETVKIILIYDNESWDYKCEFKALIKLFLEDENIEYIMIEMQGYIFWPIKKMFSLPAVKCKVNTGVFRLHCGSASVYYHRCIYLDYFYKWNQ